MGRKKNYAKRCLEAAFDAACRLEGSGTAREDIIIVHASIPFIGGHAWVEVGEEVYDLTKSDAPFDKSEYYRNWEIFLGCKVSEEGMERHQYVDYFKLCAASRSYGPFGDLFRTGRDILFKFPGSPEIKEAYDEMVADLKQKGKWEAYLNRKL